MNAETSEAETGADLEDFFQNANVGFHIISADGIILKANYAELEMLGYTASEYIGRPVCSFHVDEAVGADILARLGRGEKLAQYPARLRAKDGSIRHVRINSSAKFSDGKFIQSRCFTTDVTDTVRAERRLQQVLDALPAAVYTTDAEGNINYYNQAAADLAGRQPTLGVDKWCISWRLSAKDGTALPHDQCPMAIALRERRPVRGVEAWAERPDGKWVPFIPYPTPLYDEAGRMTGAINMMVDNTDRKRAEETQELLINELNHRVKNTLAIVQALAHQSLRRTKTSEDFVESFSGRLQALARTHTLLSQATWKGAEISKLLRDELLLAGEADSRVDLSGPLMMLAPQQALHMALIFHELATNARKYGALAAAEGSLSVSWSIKRDGEQAALHLRWLEKGTPGILSPGPAGFGTNFIQQIVLPDGGSAFMSCEATGITWDLKFVLKSQIENEIRTPSSDSFGRGKKVLIVENEALIAMELAQAVHNAGGEVAGSVGEIGEALRIINESSIDAALLDMNLNGQRSDELAAALKRLNIPFAFVTGYARESLPKAFQDAELLNKPFSSGQIGETLIRLFDKSKVVPFRTALTG